MPRNRENSFCCGAGGAQFWNEEEPGEERISDNRFREAQQTLAGTQEKVLAVGCPFCKSMLESTPEKGSDPIALRDVAELLWEGVQRKSGKLPGPIIESPSHAPEVAAAPATSQLQAAEIPPVESPAASSPQAPAVEAASMEPSAPLPQARAKWTPKSAPRTVVAPPSEPSVGVASISETPIEAGRSKAAGGAPSSILSAPDLPATNEPKRKAWAPKLSAEPQHQTPELTQAPAPTKATPESPKRKAWTPKRKAWTPKRSAEPQNQAPTPDQAAAPLEAAAESPKRKAWAPKGASKKVTED